MLAIFKSKMWSMCFNNFRVCVKQERESVWVWISPNRYGVWGKNVKTSLNTLKQNIAFYNLTGKKVIFQSEGRKIKESTFWGKLNKLARD